MMPRYQVGNKVRITNDTEGQPIELIDAVGTVIAVEPLTLHRVRSFPFTNAPTYIQEYTVDFDDAGVREGIWEEWLLPESN